MSSVDPNGPLAAASLKIAWEIVKLDVRAVGHAEFDDQALSLTVVELAERIARSFHGRLLRPPGTALKAKGRQRARKA